MTTLAAKHVAVLITRHVKSHTDPSHPLPTAILVCHTKVGVNMGVTKRPCDEVIAVICSHGHYVTLLFVG